MQEQGNAIWIANHPFWDRVLFLRQEIHRVLLSSQVKALLNMAGASLWIAETEGSDSAPGQWDRLPARYTDAFLYHVRRGRLIAREEVLGFQGIHAGDVLVFFRGDSELLGIQAEMVQGNPAFPVYVPSDLPGHKAVVTAQELMEVGRGRGEQGEKEKTSGDVVFLGDREAELAGKEGGTRGKAEAPGPVFAEIWTGLEKVVDLDRLALELSGLRQRVTDGKEDALGEKGRDRIARAEIAARAGEGGKVVEFLRSSGEALLEAAERQGAPAVRTVVEAAAGLSSLAGSISPPTGND